MLLLLAVSGAATASELIPITTLRTSGEFKETNTNTTIDVDDSEAYGFIFTFDASRDTQYEILYSLQSSDLRASRTLPREVLFDIDITYFHVGGNKLYTINDTTESYLGAGLGISRFDPDFAGYSAETKFSFNVSGGVKKMLNKSIGLRAGLSFYGTPVNSSSAIFCGSNSGCSIGFRGDLFTQFDASVGLVVRF